MPESATTRVREASNAPRSTAALAIERADAPSPRWFFAVLSALCAVYFAVELVYIRHLPLVMDEFQGAAAVAELRNAAPYSQSTPYKTVLGYYLQLPGLMLGRDVWTSLMRVKQEMALLAALVMFVAGVMLGRTFRRDAALLAIASWVCMSCFLERSAELRVDMLTGLGGLLAFLLAVQRRPVWAGIAAGLSFLVSQKGAYFCVAGGMAFGTYFLVIERSRRTFRDATLFGVAALLVIGSYVLVFGLMSSFDSVIGPTFENSAHISTSDGPYKHLREYWFQTLLRDPYFYAVSTLGIGAAYEAGRRSLAFSDWAVFAFGGSVACLALWHHQPWPYFFALVIPAFAVCAAFFFDRVSRSGRSAVFWILFVALGVVFPANRMQTALTRSNAYQRYSVRLAEAMLDPGDTYLAGVDMVFTREQSPQELSWLDVTHEEAARRRSPRSLLAKLTNKPPKLLIHNYRLDGLPSPLRRFLTRNYRQYSGAVWTYDPRIDKPNFKLAYAGDYELESGNAVEIDGHAVQPGQRTKLSAGEHVASASDFGLRFMPARAIEERVNPDFGRDENLFPHVYDW